MVVPNGPAAARLVSTWIHWWSPVASANRSTLSWSISSHPLVPSTVPVAALSSSSPVNTRIITPVSHVPATGHFQDGAGQITRHRRGEEQHDLGHFGRLAGPAH